MASPSVRWLVAVGLLGLLTQSIALGDPPRDLIPKPPQQDEPWTPPNCGLPPKIISAAEALFQQGLADPRGCEYRQVVVNTLWQDAVVMHAWVLPAQNGNSRRFAVSWDGLVHAIEKVGPPTALRADIAANLKWHLAQDTTGVADDVPLHLDELAVCLLLRIGEKELATQLWDALQVSRGNESTEEYDPYPDLARQWASSTFSQLFYSHVQAHDERALHYARLLTRTAPLIEAEARRRNANPETNDDEKLLTFTKQLPDLLADQERRARQGRRAPVICMGPDREPSAAKRIAALIERLDEVEYRDVFGRVDRISGALVQEGEAAIEPLLDCMQNDNRLTRAQPPGFCNRGESREVYYVHEVAYDMVTTILHAWPRDFEPAFTDRIVERPEPTRQELVERLRAYRRKTAHLPFAERWYQALANDQAAPDQWLHAANILVMDESRYLSRANIWYDVYRQPAAEPTPKLVGESLRGKKDPTVTALLLKRMVQVHSNSIASDLAACLARWEPALALPVLINQSRNCRKARAIGSFLDLMQLRVEAGDERALYEYADWLRRTEPSNNSDYSQRPERQLLLMCQNANHPALGRAADYMFHNSKSPWLARFANDQNKDSRIFWHELNERLYHVPAFQRALLLELTNKAKAGDAELVDGCLRVEAEFGFGQGGNDDPQFPNRVKTDFRFCDYVAYKIGRGYAGAPRCELYWPEARRDAAVKACQAFLKKYGSRLGEDRMNFPKLNNPATEEQARLGQAIFALNGQARTVNLPKFPMPAVWLTNRDHPTVIHYFPPNSKKLVHEIFYEQKGDIWQAEEFWDGSRWQRFYGFAGIHQIAKVPAAEIEFPDSDWLSLPHGIDVRLQGPVVKGNMDDENNPRVPANQPIALALWLRNRTGLDLTVTRGETPLRLELHYSPEMISRKGMPVPEAKGDSDWTPILMRAGAAVIVPSPHSLGPAQETLAGEIDLRRIFPLDRPGFYRLRIIAQKSPKEEHTRLYQFSLFQPKSSTVSVSAPQ
ncbi:MAG TPA: hypothetical protein VKS79_12010 [Gemmataceae bacterium]|nr:hypothetical protein [Gemmataceae bacterium]